MKLAGARVWITGASSGIGAALATELDRRGARVAVSARRRERLEALPGASRMVVEPVDVADRESVLHAEARVRAALGGIDLAVLNAGIWEQVDVTTWDSELFRRHLDVNVMGLVHGVEAVLPDMRRRRAGVIAGMASVAGYRGFTRSEAYGATKAAELNLLESLRIDLKPLGVTAVTICPGFVRSEATDRNDFPMPFLIDAGEAATRIADGLEKDKAEIVFPRRMMLAMKAVRLLPVRPYTDVLGRLAARQLRRRGP